VSESIRSHVPVHLGTKPSSKQSRAIRRRDRAELSEGQVVVRIRHHPLQSAIHEG
jgi:hypothetical protein